MVLRYLAVALCAHASHKSHLDRRNSDRGPRHGFHLSFFGPGNRFSHRSTFQHHYTPFITSVTSIDWMVGYITWRLAQTSGLKKKYHAMAFSSMFTFTTRVTPTTSDSTRQTKGPISWDLFSVLAFRIASQQHLCFTILTITGMNILFPAS